MGLENVAFAAEIQGVDRDRKHNRAQGINAIRIQTSAENTEDKQYSHPHYVDEDIRLADRIAGMKNGVLKSNTTPEELVNGICRHISRSHANGFALSAMTLPS